VLADPRANEIYYDMVVGNSLFHEAKKLIFRRFLLALFVSLVVFQVSWWLVMSCGLKEDDRLV